MGIPVLILGESGSGKSTSLRNFNEDEIGIFNVAGKPLPFRKKLKVANNATYRKIMDNLPHKDKDGKFPAEYLKAFAIDDSQYLLAFEFFDRAKEVGYGKFTDIAMNFRNLINFVIAQTPPDCIVYFCCAGQMTGNTALSRSRTVSQRRKARWICLKRKLITT